MSNSRAPIRAPANWWGTSDTNEIENKIWDYGDDLALGRVDYEPYEVLLIKAASSVSAIMRVASEQVALWTVDAFPLPTPTSLPSQTPSPTPIPSMKPVHPTDMMFTSDGSLAYISCGNAYYVVVLDVATGTVSNRIMDVGMEPVAIAITPDDKFAYVTNKEGESVSVIDLATNTVVARISTRG